MTYDYDTMCVDTFLDKQLQLLPKKVAETREEAEDFLDMCMAVVCKDIKEVRDYMDQAGLDITGMSLKDLESCEEVFALPDGRFLVVEA